MSSDFVVDQSDPLFANRLGFAIVATTGSSVYSNERTRPYTGQAHTDHGIRGKTLVSGLTMRDIADCIVQGFLSASGNPELQDKCFPLDADQSYKKGTWRYEDMYKIDGANLDPQAVIQNALCYAEKYMGIFPNIGVPASIGSILQDPSIDKENL